MARAKPVLLTEDQRAELQALFCDADISEIRERASLILRLAEGMTHEQVQADMHRSNGWVKIWKARYLGHGMAGLQVVRPRGRPRRQSGSLTVEAARSAAHAPPPVVEDKRPGARAPSGPSAGEPSAARLADAVSEPGTPMESIPTPVSAFTAGPDHKLDHLKPVFEVRIPIGVLGTRIGADGRSRLNWLIELTLAIGPSHPRRAPAVAQGEPPLNQRRRPVEPTEQGVAAMPLLLFRPCLHRALDPAVRAAVRTGKAPDRVWLSEERKGTVDHLVPSAGDLADIKLRTRRKATRLLLEGGLAENKFNPSVLGSRGQLRFQRRQTLLHMPFLLLGNTGHAGGAGPTARSWTAPAALRANIGSLRAEFQASSELPLPAERVDLFQQLGRLGVHSRGERARLVEKFLRPTPADVQAMHWDWQTESGVRMTVRSVPMALPDDAHIFHDEAPDAAPTAAAPPWPWVAEWLQGAVLRDAVEALRAPGGEGPVGAGLRFQPSPFLLGGWPCLTAQHPYFVYLRFVAEPGDDARALCLLESKAAALSHDGDGRVLLTAGGFVEAGSELEAREKAERSARQAGARGTLEFWVACR